MTLTKPTIDYPEGMQAQIDMSLPQTVVEVFNRFCQQFHAKEAFRCLRHSLSFADLDRLSRHFAAYLQHCADLQPGDRIAIQMPNLLQYPVVLFGSLRAGMVVVNTNPLYTEHELLHQLQDASVKAVVVYAGVAAKLQNILPQTAITQVIVTEVADLHPWPKRVLLNGVVKYVKKMVPSYDASSMHSLTEVLARGSQLSLVEHKGSPEDIAILQYTGGTTGIAKGAMLSHRNLVANMLQSMELFRSIAQAGQERFVAPLPLYHIFAFTIHAMVLASAGCCNILIPNPRDIPGFIKTLQQESFSGFVGLNTLFVALMKHPKFREVDFSALKVTVSGGMALTEDAAKRWHQITGSHILEGYGMTEASPVIAFNVPSRPKIGYIGVPAPSTEVKAVDDQGQDVPLGEIGELCVRGPQIMQGYWNRPEETAHIIDPQGWLHTGDMVIIEPNGYMKIIDRKKDMILVSGFNVYPTEIENVVSHHPAVVECAAIGVLDEDSGERVRVFVVTCAPVSEQALIEHCRQYLSGYKVPKEFVFRQELPKTNVGKVLRRKLKEEAAL